MVGLSLIFSCTKIDLDPEVSCGFIRDLRQQRVLWDTSEFPITMNIHESVPRRAYDALEQCVGLWNQNVGYTMVRLNWNLIGTDRRKSVDGKNTIYWWADNWDPNQSSFQAKTTLHWFSNAKNSFVKEGDIHFNDENHNFGFSESEVIGTENVDFVSVCLHEIGHVFGLKHKDQIIMSIMQPYLKPGEIRDQFYHTDLQSLRCGYGEQWVKTQPVGDTFASKSFEDSHVHLNRKEADTSKDESFFAKRRK